MRTRRKSTFHDGSDIKGQQDKTKDKVIVKKVKTPNTKSKTKLSSKDAKVIQRKRKSETDHEFSKNSDDDFEKIDSKKECVVSKQNGTHNEEKRRSERRKTVGTSVTPSSKIEEKLEQTPSAKLKSLMNATKKKDIKKNLLESETKTRNTRNKKNNTSNKGNNKNKVHNKEKKNSLKKIIKKYKNEKYTDEEEEEEEEESEEDDNSVKDEDFRPSDEDVDSDWEEVKGN